MLEGSDIPPGSLVAGVPAKVRRELSDDERSAIVQNAVNYRAHVGVHSEAAPVVP